MTEQASAIYEKAITTDRPAEMLARKHGFESVADLAGSLPPHARVLDVGAGASPFGCEVAASRPDISWVNYDYSYKDPVILEDVSKDAPENIEYISGDATKLDEVFDPESFDAVFSYWLLPHLSIDDSLPAAKTARAIYGSVKIGGVISVGPKSSHKRLPSIRSGKAIKLLKTDELDADSYAEMIVSKTRLPKIGRHIQRLANEVGTPFFDTTRYAKRDGPIPKVYHPKSGEYVLPFGPRGYATLGRLAIALARHTIDSDRSE